MCRCADAFGNNKRYGIPAVQLVKNLQLEQVVDGIELRKASRYLSKLEM